MKNPNYKQIGSFEDACKAKGVDAEQFVANLVAAGLSADKISEAKLELFAEAVNGDWKGTYKNRDQKKWFPYFWFSSSGFVLAYVYSHYDVAAVSPRLCFETAEQARHAGNIMLKDYEVYYS